MLAIIARVVAAVLIVGAVAGGTFIVGMRRGWRPVVDALRAVNRRVLNPRQMRSAGAPGAYASIVRHSGRRSGRAYETPVVAEATDDGFAVALPYGTRSDWVRNVLAAGRATILDEGSEHRVDRPRLVPMQEVEELFPEKDRRGHRMFGVDRALIVDRAA